MINLSLLGADIRLNQNTYMCFHIIRHVKYNRLPIHFEGAKFVVTYNNAVRSAVSAWIKNHTDFKDPIDKKAFAIADAISTHRFVCDNDHFDATDSPNNTATGNHESTSIVYYEYACVNITELVAKIGNDSAAKEVAAFAEGLIKAFPVQHINDIHEDFPPLVYVNVYRHPDNYFAAFDRPVSGSDECTAASCKRLKEYASGMPEFYGESPFKQWYIGEDFIGEKTSLNGLLENIKNTVRETDVAALIKKIYDAYEENKKTSNQK